jgi:SAM-dependent methyltransferase
MPADPFEACFPDRANMLEVKEEGWRPPHFERPSGWVAEAAARLRRFFDLQNGSIWNDLSRVLPLAVGTVLDVGCGGQPYRPLVGAGAKYRGIDYAYAKSNFGYEMPDTTYYDGSVWPVEDASVDFILCTETLEHVLDSRQFLGEARRCLRPGGWILLTIPFAARWHFIPYDYWRMTPSALDYLLRECGFAGARVYARGNAGTVACYKTMAIILPLLMPQGRGLMGTGTRRLVGIPLIPVLAILAIAANLTLRGRGGDDCLGYTVLAKRT